MVQGVVTDQESGRRAGQVLVYGVDDRFWRFHGAAAVAADRGSRGLRQSGAGARDRRRDRSAPILVRVAAAVRHPARVAARPEGRPRPHDAPDGARGAAGVERSASSRSSRTGRRSRRIRAAGAPAGGARARRARQRAAGPAAGERQRAGDISPQHRQRGGALEDIGITLTVGDDRPHDRRGLDRRTPRARDMSRRSSRPWGRAAFAAQPVFTYLANTIRAGDREIPYSLVTATNLDRLTTNVRAGGQPTPGTADARRPGTRTTRTHPPHRMGRPRPAGRAGDRFRSSTTSGTSGGRLVTRSADFRLAGDRADRRRQIATWCRRSPA